MNYVPDCPQNRLRPKFLSRTEAAEAALTRLFWDDLFVCFLQFLFSLVVEFLISAIRLSRLLPKFIGAAHNIDCSGALHFLASLNCSFRQHPFGASFIDYCYASAVFDRELQPKHSLANPAVTSLPS
jgi:hypothetical protein